jgi:AcrR family transcriptional regulator
MRLTENWHIAETAILTHSAPIWKNITYGGGIFMHPLDKEKILELLAQGVGVRAACKSVGVGRASFYRLLHRDAVFLAKVRVIREHRRERIDKLRDAAEVARAEKEVKQKLGIPFAPEKANKPEERIQIAGAYRGYVVWRKCTPEPKPPKPISAWERLTWGLEH